MTDEGDPIPRETVDVLDVPLAVHSRASMADVILDWAGAGRSAYVCAVNVHSTMEARRSPAMEAALVGADLNIPDGVPVAWGMALLGAEGHERVHGATLMWDLCRGAESKGLPIALYGSTEDVLTELLANMRRTFPKLDIRDAISPPFRALEPEEDAAMVERLNASGTRILFVGLGAPKQELWMHEHRDAVDAVMVGVGAAFDIHAGRVRRAPAWMQRAGLEWAYRLLQEPGRLWRRYAVNNPRYVAALAAQLVRERRGSRRGTAHQ